jgi:glyoxylase-like metal-dependent hydrolase (beta-lactamase superfamily II)
MASAHAGGNVSQVFTVGEVVGQVVTDGGFAYVPDFLFANAPESELQDELAGRLTEDGKLWTPYDCVLLRTPTQTVLVDAGGGGAWSPSTGLLLSSLAAVGVQPSDVDLVVVTHAHVDHIGGLVEDGALVFPAARHVVSGVEWSTWTSEEVLSRLPAALADPARRVLPKLENAGLIDLVQGDVEVAPGIYLVPAHGHTPGHCVVAVRSAGEELVLLADSMFDELSLAHPEWTAVPDMDPDETVATRRRLLDRAVSDSVRVLGYHFAGIHRVEHTQGGYRFAR